MAEDPLRKYGYLRDWEWWQPKPRRPRQYDEPGGYGRAQAKAAAAGYSNVDEWAAAGWPHPTDPDTGSPYEGYKIDRMERGRHPEGRKMADEDWFNIRTQNIFDYLRGAQVYSTHYDWADRMRAKYPNYPMPGISMDDLLRKLFPDWYDGEEEPTPTAPREVLLPTAAIFEEMIPPAARAWMERLGMVPGEEREGMRRPVEGRALPVYGRTEAEREEQRRAIRGRELPGRPGRRPGVRGEAEEEIGPDWAGFLEREEEKPRSWQDYLREAVEEAPKAPTPAEIWEGIEELIERAKGLIETQDLVAAAEAMPKPEEVAVGVGKVLFNLPILSVLLGEAALRRLEGAIPIADKLVGVREETASKIIATALLPAEWAEVGLSQLYLQRLHIVKAGEVPEEWKGNVEAEAGYELGHLFGDLDEKTRGMMIGWIARIGWSPFQHQLAAAKRILDPKEYEGWARYEGELVEIRPGIPLAEGYVPVDMYDPGVVTQILRREEHPLAEMLGRTIVDPLNIFYVAKVRAAPGDVWTRLTGKPTGPLAAAHETLEQYAKAGGMIDEPTKEFLRSHRLKPRWYQKAVGNTISDWFQDLPSRYAAWRAKGAPRVIMTGIPEKAGDLTEYMRAAARAEDELARSYSLVYPRAGTDDPNFLQVVARALSGGLDPAQVREMRVLVIEAEAYREMGNAEGAAEKVAVLERMAKEGLSISERGNLLWELFRTKAGSMALNRPTPQASAMTMADDAIRVLGWMYEDMPGGIDRAVTALLLKKDPKQLVKEFPWINSKRGLEAFRLFQHIRDDALGSMAFATGIPSTETQAAWTNFHTSLRRIAGTYMYPSPRRDPLQRLWGMFYKIAPRTFLSTGRYPIQNISSNFTNIWARYGWVTPRSDASSIEFINRFMGDAGFLPPGSARSITAAGEVSTERTPTLLGRKWVYEGPTARGREPPTDEAFEAAKKLARRPSPVEWAARLAKKAGRFLPFGEGMIDLSKWGERNASMANYRDLVENIKGAQGRPRRGGFLPGLPEGIEADAAMRAASDEIIASSWNWGEILERHAELYGAERVAKAAHYVSTERIRNLGAEALDVADDLMEALSLSPSRSAFQRRYRLIKDGIGRQVQEWINAEPDYPEGLELPMAPLESLSAEEAQRLMAFTGTTERNHRHMKRATQVLTDLARKAGIGPEKAMEIVAIAIDKGWTAYSAYGPEASRLRDYFHNVLIVDDPSKRRLWPIYEERIGKMATTSHENFDREIYNAAMKLGGDPDVVREELGLFPWGGPPKDIVARKMRDLQDDVINTVYTMQAEELLLAPEGIETPDLESVKAIQQWVDEKPIAANAWLEYMREAIGDKAIAEAAELVARTPAETIKRERRAAWREGTARRIELMEDKITRLQSEIATSPVEAADIEQLTGRQQELYGLAMELEGMKDTLASLPTQREVFRFWDYKEGDFRRVKDPSGRVAEFAQSQIVQEIAYKHYGFQQGVAGAEAFGDMIRQRLGLSNRIASIENLIWEEPELVLPETAESLEAFIKASEPQLDQLMQYEREPYLFEAGLQAYEQAVDLLAKIRGGEAMPKSVASSIKSAKEEIARLEGEREAIRREALARNRIPASAEQQELLSQELSELNEQYVAKGIVTRNKLGQAPLFEDMEELKERGLMKRQERKPRKAEPKKGLEKIGYRHYYYTLTPEGRAIVDGTPVTKLEEVPKLVPPGSQWVEPVGVEGAEAGPPVTAAEQAALFGAPEEVGMPKPEVPAPQLPGLEASELYGGREIPMEIPEVARERPLPLEMEIEGLTPEEAERIAMEKGAVPLPGVEMTEIQRQQRIADVESLISEGETRLKTGKDIIGGDLTPEGTGDTRKTLESYKAELARLQVAPEAVAPEVPEVAPQRWPAIPDVIQFKVGVQAIPKAEIERMLRGLEGTFGLEGAMVTILGELQKALGPFTAQEKDSAREIINTIGREIGITDAPKPELPKPAEILREEGVLPAYEKPAGVPTMLTNAHRQGLQALGYSESLINQMTPEQGMELIREGTKDWAPAVKTPAGPMRDIESPVMPPSPREGAVLKRDMLLQRMDEWYKDALKEFGKELEGDPSNFGPVSQWLESELRGHWGQFKIYMDKMGEATTAWTLYSYRKLNVDTLLYRGFWWPYWQTRTGHRWLLTFMENPAKLALWARWHDTHQKINDDLPENYRDTVHIPDWIPVVGGRHWNPYFFFDPVYAWIWSLDNFIPTWKKQGLLDAMVTALPISPLVGMREAVQPMITEEGRRMEPITPWTRALYEKTDINIEAGAVKGLETLYGEVKPSIYSAMEKGSRSLAQRVLGGPEVMPIIAEGRYRPTYLARVLIDMWLAEEVTWDEFEEASANREGPIWDRVLEEVKRERGLTEFSSIFTGVRARKLYPSEYEIEEFKRMRGMLRTMEEGPEKREYREEIYDTFPWARQWDVRYDSVESAKMEVTISEAWQDVENESVISDKKLADAIRERPGDLAHAYDVKQENREREEDKRSFWRRQGVSFVFNPRTRTYEEIEDWVRGRLLSQFYFHLPQADKFKDEEGAIDWDAYNGAVETFWEELPEEIVKWGDVQQMDLEIRDAVGTEVFVLQLAKEVATEEAYDVWRKDNDLPEEALNAVWKEYVIDVANEYYQEELKDLEYADRNMPAFFAEFGQKSAEEMIPYILQEYPGRWTEEELTERLAAVEGPLLTFLREGKASHPDEAEPREEYDAIISALTTGEGIRGAIAIAQSHLDAHKNALGRGRDTVQDPYPGEPEKNQAAVDGFEGVVKALQEGARLDAKMTMPGIWERWNQDTDDKSIGISLLWAFWGGQTGLGRRRLKELINDPIYNQFFIDKETRDYDRITPEDLEKWIKQLNIPNPWDDREGAQKTLYYWTVDSTGDPLLYPREEEPEARGGRAPGLAAPMPERGGPWRGEGEPPVPEEEAPPEAPRAIPQLAGTSESAQYARAQDEMAAWVAAGKEGDWSPLMEQWFGKDTPAGFFWEYYWDKIPPGRIADEVRKDPIIEMLLNKAFRTVYDVKEGTYEVALETLQAWAEAHPELPGDPKEWAIVRQIVGKYWELRELGETNEARALWMYFTALLEPYYPSTYTPSKRRRAGRRFRGGGGRARSRRPSKIFRRWRRWVAIRQYPTR